MELLADLAGWSLLLFGLLLFACQLRSHQVGFLLGERRETAGAASNTDGVGLVVTGLLGLFAFVLALTLSYSSVRFAERRAAVLAEANAIGTAWLRAQAIGHPRGGEIAELLGQYGRLRRDYVQAARNSPAIEKINDRSSLLQTELWTQLSAITRERSDPAVVALMTALNETFDAGTAERFALETRFPAQLFWLLIGMALISAAAFGYQLGLKGQRIPILVALLLAVWTTVIIVILDLNASRLGAFRTSVAVYDWTLKSMAGQAASAQRPAGN